MLKLRKLTVFNINEDGDFIFLQKHRCNEYLIVE